MYFSDCMVLRSIPWHSKYNNRPLHSVVDHRQHDLALTNHTTNNVYIYRLQINTNHDTIFLLYFSYTFHNIGTFVATFGVKNNYLGGGVWGEFFSFGGFSQQHCINFLLVNPLHINIAYWTKKNRPLHLLMEVSANCFVGSAILCSCGLFWGPCSFPDICSYL